MTELGRHQSRSAWLGRKPTLRATARLAGGMLPSAHQRNKTVVEIVKGSRDRELGLAYVPPPLPSLGGFMVVNSGRPLLRQKALTHLRPPRAVFEGELIPVHKEYAKDALVLADQDGQYRPSRELARQLLGESRLDDEESQIAAAQDHIVEAMRDLWSAIAEASHHDGERQPFVLGGDEGFSDEIAQALSFRFSLPFRHQAAFVDSLYRDVAPAVAMGHIVGPYWKLQFDAGKLVLVLTGGPPAFPEMAPRKRATPVRIEAAES